METAIKAFAVIVEDICDNGKAYVCTDIKKVRSEMDRSGISAAVKLKDTVKMGSVFYDYAPYLARFINANGENWRSILNHAFENGVYPDTTSKSDIGYLEKMCKGRI
jgi:hypothetical protein